MALRKQHAPQHTRPSFVARSLLGIILLLIALGNGIRSFLIFLILSPLAVVSITKRLTAETGAAMINWAHEKVTKPRARRSKPPRPNRPLQFPDIMPDLSAFSVHIKTIRAWKLPSITLPRLHLPPIAVRFPTRRRVPKPAPAPLSAKPALHLPSLGIGIIISLLFILLPYNSWLFLKSLPNPQLLSQRDIEVTTKIFDRNGQLLYEIYADQNRTPMPLTKIPQYVKDATIVIEDRDFYRHLGFSVRGILRAARETLVHKQIQGGSTITQQLIKSALLTPEVSLIRKTKEIILAFWAERIYSKDQILEMYFNQVPYGGTAWGIEAAAQTYFHKSVTQLSLAEAALLAGLPAAPSEYSPFGNHPEKALQRQKEVLTRMKNDGAITEQQMNQALAEPIRFAQPVVGIRAPHFVMYVKELLEKKYGTRLVERGGLRVTTSLDITLEERVENIVKNSIDSLTNLNVGNGAALVTNPKTGEILAMVGSRNYFDVAHDGNVNVTTSLRQPGSSIKVVTYAAALENGFTAASILQDSPVIFKQVGSTTYQPVNYDGKFHGLVPLRYALANSYNIPAVKTLAAIGVPTMLAKAKLMGIDSWSSDPSRYGLSLTLGGGDVTMLEMAKVYGTLANMGTRVDLLPVLKVTDYTGNVIEDNKPGSGVSAVRADVAWILTNILSDNNARSAAFGLNSALVIPGKTVAVKTGTTNEKRDNWTAGYTPSYVAVVWVGNNDNSPMNPVLTSGITGAAPIWHDIMTELLKNRMDEATEKPDTVVSLPCYFGKNEYFVKGTEPSGSRCAPMPTATPTPTP